VTRSVSVRTTRQKRSRPRSLEATLLRLPVARFPSSARRRVRSSPSFPFGAFRVVARLPVSRRHRSSHLDSSDRFPVGRPNPSRVGRFPVGRLDCPRRR
jgi:hypothetical protein